MVVLPAPFAPSSAQCSPDRTLQSTASRMTWPVVYRRMPTPSRAAITPVAPGAGCGAVRAREGADGEGSQGCEGCVGLIAAE